MIKKFLFAAVCICSLSFVSQAQQALKFGTVNSQEIFMLMPEKATAEQTLQDINKKYEDEFVKIQEEFTKKYKEYMALGDKIAETIRASRRHGVQESQSQIESLREMTAIGSEYRQEGLVAPIQQKLMDAIKSVGAEGKFTYIFDLAYPIVIYQGAPSEDVTPLVKAKLGLK